MATSKRPPASPLSSMAPPGSKARRDAAPAALPPARDPAEETGRARRIGFGPQPAQTDVRRQAVQASALQRTADAAFDSIAALEADTQLALEQRALALVAFGLSLWRHCRGDAPFQGPGEFRGWIDGAGADLDALARTLASLRPAPPQRTLVEQLGDAPMLAVAAERTPRRWVDDYWARLGTTPDDPRPGVFLSYSKVDRLEARELKRALGPELLVVLDADYLRGGETWWKALGNALTHCAATLVLVSPASMESIPVEREISKAFAQEVRTRGRHRLVPVILVPVEELPMPLEGTNAYHVEREGGIAGVAQRLKIDLTAVRSA